MSKVQAVDEFIEKSMKRKPRKWEGCLPLNNGPIQVGAFGFVSTKVDLSGTGIKPGGSQKK